MKKEENIAPFFRRFMAFIIDVFYILLIFLGLNIIGKNVLEMNSSLFDYFVVIACFCYLVIPTGMYG